MRACVSVLLILWPLSAFPASPAGGCPPPMTLPREHVSISGQSGTRHFTVEVADTDAARAAGLMCRTALPEGHGMLFVYVRPQIARMWMKNTLFAIDFLFVAADGRVVKLASASPGSELRIVPDVPVSAVLELPGGTTARLGIRIGDELRRESRAVGPRRGGLP
jgi:hypothetical protein